MIAIKSTNTPLFEIWTDRLDHSRTFLEDLVSVEQLINVHFRRKASRFPQVTVNLVEEVYIQWRKSCGLMAAVQWDTLELCYRCTLPFAG